MSQSEVQGLVENHHSNDAVISAQDRLLYNKHYNNHHHQTNQEGAIDEHHYQLPYAHLHQSPYLPHSPYLQHPHHKSYSSDENASSYTASPHSGRGQPYHQSSLPDKYSDAYCAKEDGASRRWNRTSGSGIVYRPRRRLYWVMALLSLLLLVLSGAVFVVLYFTVLKQGAELVSQGSVPLTNNSDTERSIDTGRMIKKAHVNPEVDTSPKQATKTQKSDAVATKTQKSDAVATKTQKPDAVATKTQKPDAVATKTQKSDAVATKTQKPDAVATKTQKSDAVATQTQKSDAVATKTQKSDAVATKTQKPDAVATKTQKFDAYWHPGDSRLFVSTLTNGTIVQVFGPKTNDGTVKSIYCLSVTEVSGATKYIRFLGQRNLASVVLPSGVVVSYDWSANNIDMEVKVFEPFTERTKGPISHLALVEIGVRSYLLRQISKVMEDNPSVADEPKSAGRSGNCFSRFPVLVTKCGGQYPYDGAFVQGVITGMVKPITMAALPWPKESDPCYDQDAGVASNYYLPLPSRVGNANAAAIKKAYASSSARIFAELCNIISDQVFQEHHNLCSDMADKVRKQIGRHQLLGIVFDSCSAILKILHVACVAISGISSTGDMLALTEYSLLWSFTRRLSDSFQPGLPDKVDLKARAFCPSSLPLSSYQNTVDIRTVRGNIANDVIHINCPDYPEVTYVDVDHLLTGADTRSSLGHMDAVKHKMRICSICAFEKTVTAQIVEEEMLCNNTCLKTSVLENIAHSYSSETKDYLEQDSVYCHDFLTNVENSIDSIGRQCLGNCMSHLHVKFQIKDESVLYYEQNVQCSQLRSHVCKMKFGQ